MAKFNDKLVAALTCPADRKDALFFDGDLKGFGIRVTKGGTRTFLFQYRAAGGVRRLPIGVFGAELTTAHARIKAERLRGETRDGRDPVAERRAVRAASAAASAAAKLVEEEEAFTVRALILSWEKKHLVSKRASYRDDALARLRRHLAGILDRPASSITKVEAVRTLDRVAAEAGETTARRVMAYARAAWAWTRKRGAINSNPFEGLPPIGVEISRDRVLTPAELGAIWNAAGAMTTVHGAFARFLLLTLCRREEAARMTWGEISADRVKWTLPAARSKNRKAHIVHLPPAARQVLASVSKVKGNNLVFALNEKKGLSAFTSITKRLGRTGGDNAWRLHDFRRTGVTRLAEMGFPPHVCDRLLNHVGGTISGVAKIYQQHDFQAERRAALEGWASYITACAEGRDTPSNVVPIKGAS